ncbi:hypothetical protein [Sulfurivirga sp.]|uniref:hypothetical protein n=1 Tax=Sulfurivirga sp. TaxID=2614236 RepID=UPI0025ED672C|nr:hypothetical protein [Sulfurivirga sp.]
MKEMILASKWASAMTVVTLVALVWLIASSSGLTMELLFSLLITLPIAAPVLWLAFILLEWPVNGLIDALRPDD